MKEEWRELKEYPNYSFSSKGRVKHTSTGTILKQQHRGSQYKFVSIRNLQGKLVSKDVHRLIAQAFIPNPLNKPQVNHKDGNRINNNISNLEWVTAKENMRHAFDTGLINKETQIKAHQYNARPVVMVKNGKIVKRFRSLKETARYMNTNPISIKYVCLFSKTHIYKKDYEFYFEGDKYGKERISD